MAYNATNPNGQASSANSSPVTIASDQSTVKVKLAHDIADTNGTITNSASTVTASNLIGIGSTTIMLSGTYAGVNVTFEASMDGSNWVAIAAQTLGSTSSVLVTATGVLTSNSTNVWNISPLLGLSQVRVRATAWTSGTANVVISPSAQFTQYLTSGGSAGGTTGQNTMANSAPVTLASDQSAIPIKGNLGSVSSGSWTSATSVNSQVAMNVSAYNAVSVAMANTSTMTAGVLTFEVSPNSTNGTDGVWFALTMARIDSFTAESTYTLNTVANRAWTTSVDGFIYFRVRLSTVITGTGTASVFVTPQTFAIEPMVTVGNATAANLNATVTGTVALGAGTANVGQIGIFPTTSNGGLTLTNQSQQSLTNTVVYIKTSIARLMEYDFYNPNSSGVWVQIFNLASGVVLGTTAPTRTIYIPATSGRDWASPWSMSLSLGLAIACTTTNTGSTAPTTPIQAYIGYV